MYLLQPTMPSWGLYYYAHYICPGRPNSGASAFRRTGKPGVHWESTCHWHTNDSYQWLKLWVSVSPLVDRWCLVPMRGPGSVFLTAAARVIPDVGNWGADRLGEKEVAHWEENSVNSASHITYWEEQYHPSPYPATLHMGLCPSFLGTHQPH